MAVLASASLACLPSPARASADPLDREDRQYLENLARDTWACIEHFVSEKTGLPYDSDKRLSRPGTSITNIGLYLACAAAAAELGFIPESEARERAGKALKSLRNVQKWRGAFPVTWVNTDTLETTENQFSTVDHLGNLCAGLTVVKSAFPELREDADAVLAPMDWGIIYDPDNGLYKGGFRLDLDDFDIRQSWGDWHYGNLGADTRLGSFFGLARGQVPLKHWQSLDRRTETMYGQEYLTPGWQGGGLFMQMISGLFLDERATVLGKSAANFAYAQVLHARAIGTPVWGWSAAEGPTGEYLGWGAIRDAVVTPHASALALPYYPRRVVQNLKTLENLGARPKAVDGGRAHDFGFRDSLDWQTGRVASGYLVLDQAMLFLSIANFLQDGAIWKWFGKDPVVRNGLEIIPEYGQSDPKALRVYAERDMEPPTEELTLPLGAKR